LKKSFTRVIPNVSGKYRKFNHKTFFFATYEEGQIS
jgi:hypothetical protein